MNIIAGSGVETMQENNLHIILIKKKISQSKLADHLEVTPQQVNNWVKGRSVPRMDILLKISDYLDCTIDDIYRVE